MSKLATVLFVMVILTAIGSVQGNASSESASAVLDRWAKQLEDTRRARQAPDSLIYDDVYVSLAKFDNGVYLYRTRQGSDNFLVKTSSASMEMRLGQEYLGSIQKNSASPSGFSYIELSSDGSELRRLDLVDAALVTVPSQSIALKFSADSKSPTAEIFNYQRPHAELFKNPENFPYDPHFRVLATYKAYPEPVKASVLRNGGTYRDESKMGEITFSLGGRSYTFPVWGYSSDESEIRFRDTSPEVYPGGRILTFSDADKDSGQPFFIDFNFAFEPPCAYSQSFTLCSMPDVNESIESAVTAGRKYALRNLK